MTRWNRLSLEAVTLLLVACGRSDHECPALGSYICEDGVLKVCTENWFDRSLWDWLPVTCSVKGDGNGPWNCPTADVGPVVCLKTRCYCER